MSHLHQRESRSHLAEAYTMLESVAHEVGVSVFNHAGQVYPTCDLGQPRAPAYGYIGVRTYYDRENPGGPAIHLNCVGADETVVAFGHELVHALQDASDFNDALAIHLRGQFPEWVPAADALDNRSFVPFELSQELHAWYGQRRLFAHLGLRQPAIRDEMVRVMLLTYLHDAPVWAIKAAHMTLCNYMQGDWREMRGLFDDRLTEDERFHLIREEKEMLVQLLATTASESRRPYKSTECHLHHSGGYVR